MRMEGYDLACRDRQFGSFPAKVAMVIEGDTFLQWKHAVVENV